MRRMRLKSLPLLLLLLAGCGVVETAVDLPGNTIRAVTPEEKMLLRSISPNCRRRCSAFPTASSGG